MKRQYLFIILLVFVFGCDDNTLPGLSEESNIVGLASGVKLSPGNTEVLLADFYLDSSTIENIELPGYPDSLYFRDGDRLLLRPTPEMPALLGMEVTAAGITECIPLFRSGKQAVEFIYDPGAEQHESVAVRGEFNGWTPGRPAFEFVDGLWKAEMMLKPGTYQYLLLIDGEDRLDPANPEKIDNNAGGFNSLLSIGMDVVGKLPQICTLEDKGDEIEIGIEKNTDGIFVLWQNIRLSGAYIEQEDDSVYEIRIPAAAENIKRSFIRIWAWNEYGVSNDLLIPLEYGKVLDDPALINRHDKHSMILYNAFVDRFFDADPSNNRPLNNPEVLPPADYHGGDIKGVTQKIRDGYFKGLGVNTVWISPIVKNPEGAFGFWPDPPSKFSGYHGYWPTSFTLIDDRYGTEADLHELVSLAHEEDMNVLLDFVANHVHQEHPLYQAHPDWATELYLPDGSLNTERWDEYRLTTWFDVFLPTLDLSKPEVYEMLSDSAVYWIRKYKLDGFRHDATKHIPEVFWRTLTKKLKKEFIAGEGRHIYQIGETYGGPELIGSYVGSGMLDAQFDFNVYDDALAVLCNDDQPFSRLESSLHESLQYYGAHNLMGYITGNQDRGRFTSYAGAGLRFDEDAKLAGWTREITVGNKSGYKATEMLFAFNMTTPGLPVIYYGDEIGMPGGNDPDNRRMMRFDELADEENEVLETVKKLTELRLKNIPLIYGDLETLLLTEHTWAYCRTYFDEIVIILMNKNAQTKNLTFALPERFAEQEFESNFGYVPGVRKGSMSVTIGGRSFDVITVRK
ncbi:MAG: alpha-amylase family glycosyl hydrolase [Bacteroidota bacterium]